MSVVVTLLPLVPLRQESSHRAEQVSQLLFGEKAEILEEHGEWALIKTHNDHYSGWVELKSLSENGTTNFNRPILVLAQPLFGVYYKRALIYLPAGSELPVDASNGTIVLGENEFIIPPKTKSKPFEIGKTLADTATRFLNAPYLWGGRTILGFDCSGFSQLVYKLHGKKLPRDAKEQAKEGMAVEFIQEALPGDLIFFDNEEGTITHVGIYMGENLIIHASASVHIDNVDQQGIFNLERKEYSHKLRLIRRIE